MAATKRITGVITALMVMSACAAPETSSLSAPILPVPTTTSSSTTTTTTASPTEPPVTIPVDLVGKSAATVEQQLKALGFTSINYVDKAGNPVASSTTWIVESVEGAGTGVARSRAVFVHVAQPPAPAPPPAPKEPEPVVEPEPEPPAAAYYKNCAAAKAAHAAPLHRGDPGYRAGLDRDNDGVACE